jgi:hypothetical protein
MTTKTVLTGRTKETVPILLARAVKLFRKRIDVTVILIAMMTPMKWAALPLSARTEIQSHKIAVAMASTTAPMSRTN